MAEKDPLSPSLTGEELLASLRQQPDSEPMLHVWSDYLKTTTDSMERFRAIQSVILHHEKFEAALPLIDAVRDEMEAQSLHVRAILAYYEERARGSSSFLAGVTDPVRTMIAEAKDFIVRHPLDTEIQIAEDLMSHAMAASEFESRIEDAVRRAEPLSVLRMGDGEGRFMRRLDDWPLIQLMAIETSRNVWFRNSEFPDLPFWQALRQSYAACDIVGVCPPYRINLAYRNSAPGFVGVVSGNRFLAEARQNGAAFAIGPRWTFGECRPEFFKDLISGSETVHFIGPHQGMRDYLRDVLGARDVDLRLIPACNLVPSAVERPHFPDVYEEVLEYIRGGAKGLWLVSAGAYAKIYCNEIRKAGGVGLDIGSTSDSWMNMKTR